MIVIALITVFITENPWMLDQDQFVRFTFFGYRTVPLSIPLTMVFCVLVGALTIFLSMFMTQLRLKGRVKEQSRSLLLMEREINELRNLPITEIEEDLDEITALDEDSE